MPPSVVPGTMLLPAQSAVARFVRHVQLTGDARRRPCALEAVQPGAF